VNNKTAKLIVRVAERAGGPKTGKARKKLLASLRALWRGCPRNLRSQLRANPLKLDPRHVRWDVEDEMRQW
jgi:hypothetical protein